jgi:hypothetical protein
VDSWLSSGCPTAFFVCLLDDADGVNRVSFYHEHHCFLRCACLVHYAFGDRCAFVRVQFKRLVFQINVQFSAQNKEKFVVVVVLVPMILALDNPDADNAAIDFRQRLIEPCIGAFFHDVVHINEVLMGILDVHALVVVELRCHSGYSDGYDSYP